jgi:hypothetical protein
MSWWGAYALVISALPVMLVVRWVVADWFKIRRQARIGTKPGDDPWHANAIVARIQKKRAEEEAAEAPTETLPVVRSEQS